MADGTGSAVSPVKASVHRHRAPGHGWPGRAGLPASTLVAGCAVDAAPARRKGVAELGPGGSEGRTAVRQDAQPRRSRWIRPILVPTLIAIVAVGSIGVGARAWFDTRDESDRTAAEVRETRSHLAGARDDLVGANADLRAQRAALHAGLATLDAREGERDAAEAALATAENRLAELRAELAAATTDLAERENLLQALDRCVRGVVEALNQAAVGDIVGVDASLAGVEAPCALAGANR